MSAPDGSLSRRSFVRLLGGAAGVSLLPLNFGGCDGLGAPVIIGSSHLPTPEAPLTPRDDFYVNANFGLPEMPAPSLWRLHLRGLVRQPVTLTLDDLRALPQETRQITLECVGNTEDGQLISSAAFRGPLLRTVLALAGREPDALGLYFRGCDGFPAYLPATVAEDDNSLVALDLGGAPLRLENGAPARVLLAGRYGMYSCKWLDSITATRTWHPLGGLQGVSTGVAGKKRVRSRLDRPRPGREVTVGEAAEVTGLAASDGSGIARVEVRVDDGPWQPAELTFNTLHDGRSPHLWTLWRFRWTPARAGEHRLSVRAFDAAGGRQDPSPDFPYDGSAIHTVRVLARDP